MIKREFTVVLKEADKPPQSAGSRLWAALNEFVKSPVFGILFGAGAIGLWVTFFHQMATPKAQLDLERKELQARTDAALIAPFLQHLDSSQEGKFAAAKAALQQLNDSIKAADGEHPMFTAVLQAVAAVDKTLRPPPGQQLPEPDAQKAYAAAPAVPVDPKAVASYGALRDALVYVQVSQNGQTGKGLADKLVKDLRAHAISAPGIEPLANGKMPEKTQVRYFNDSDKNQAEALAAVVRQLPASDVLIAKPKLNAKPGVLEVWFARE